MTSLASPSLPPLSFEGPRRLPVGVSPRAGLAAGLGLIAVWALWAAIFNSAQFGDNVEQYNWAQSLELGYHKHPPLPSWLLGGTVRLFGPSVYWAYLLAAMCLIGSATFTWLLGRDLIGPRGASAAILLWGLNMTFAQRAQLYNHNTVLVLCVAATAWFAWRASRAQRFVAGWWLATGTFAAGAVLSKYQALVPLAGIALALAASGKLTEPRARGGVLLAAGSALALCTPHLAWVASHHFTTLRYATEAVEPLNAAQRGGVILSFIANQLRIWSPAMLAMLLTVLARRLRPSSETFAAAAEVGPGAALRLEHGAAGPWIVGLLWFGLVFLAVMALGFGVSLRNHWGAQALQFFPLWLAWRWQRRGPIDLSRLLVAVVAVHALNLAWYAIEHRTPSTVLSERRIDTAYPARRLAVAASRHWHSHTACPLQYVAGTAFDAGLVSLYSEGRPRVFDSETATPWIDRAHLQKSGALVVLDEAHAVPADIADVVSFDLAPGEHAGRPAKTVRIGLRYPTSPC